LLKACDTRRRVVALLFERDSFQRVTVPRRNGCI
jgi:hypothetical protein